MGLSFDTIDSYIDLELQKLMLRGGNYYVVVVVQTKIRVVKQIDLLHHVLNFKVFSGDFWNANKANRATNVALIDATYLNPTK